MTNHRRAVFTILALSLMTLTTACGMTTVEPGHVGIKVNMYGSDRGVQDYPLVTGRVWYNPFTTRVFSYPTFMQTTAWTKNPNEGREGRNDELSFNSHEGMNFHADVSLAYALDPKRVPFFYVKFRSDDLNTFTHGFLRITAQNAFNAVAVNYTAEQIYGDKKDEVLKEVLVVINTEVEQYGVRIEQFGFIGTPRPPGQIAEAINAKIRAIQDAIRTENELRQTKAEAAKVVAQAEGQAKARIAVAEGEARANQLLNASLSSQLLTWQAIQKWDGHRPQVEGQGSGLLFSLQGR